jgi:propanediol dehydratase small subunit
MFVIVLVAAIAIVLLFLAPKRHVTLRPYWERHCAGRAWRRAFPSASREQIRRFLRLFVEAFAFPEKRMLKFAPNDRIYDIYKAANPTEGWPDALELESLAKRLRVTYGLDLRATWSESLTLGELFHRASRWVV